jgi:hypothetical protein
MGVVQKMFADTATIVDAMTVAPIISPRGHCIKIEDVQKFQHGLDCLLLRAIKDCNYIFVKALSFTRYSVSTEAIVKAVTGDDVTIVELISGMELRDESGESLRRETWGFVRSGNARACLSVLAIPAIHNYVSFRDIVAWACCCGMFEMAETFVKRSDSYRVEEELLLHTKAAVIQRYWRKDSNHLRSLDEPPDVKCCVPELLINQRILDLRLARGNPCYYPQFVSHLRTDVLTAVGNMADATTARFLIISALRIRDTEYVYVLYKQLDTLTPNIEDVLNWLISPPSCYSQHGQPMLFCYAEHGFGWESKHSVGVIAPVESWPDASTIEEHVAWMHRADRT